MDTKLKRYSKIWKSLAFLLIAASAALLIMVLLNIKGLMREHGDFYRNIPQNMIADHYEETSMYRETVDSVGCRISEICLYGSEERILRGDALSPNDVIDRMEVEFRQKHYYQDGLEKVFDGSMTEKERWDYIQEFHKEQMEAVRDTMIQEQLYRYQSAMQNLMKEAHLLYIIETPETTLSNTDSSRIADMKYTFSFDDGTGSFTYRWAYDFEATHVEALDRTFLSDRQALGRQLILAAACILVFLAALAYLIYAAGKRATDPFGIHHSIADRIFNEITLTLLGLSCMAVMGSARVILEESLNPTAMTALFTACTMLSVAFALMLIRHIKSRTFWQNMLIYIVLRHVFLSVKKVFDAGTVMRKAMVLVIVTVLSTAIPYGIFVVLPLAVFFTYRQVQKFMTVRVGMESIKQGFYHENIFVKGTGEMAALAADMNTLSAGLGQEVDRRLKSERLKTELIVNVSHDLKTPLTSVITYVDLLQNEKIESETARQYIDIVAAKSNRLKVLVEDLFEAAKAASGNIPVHYEDVDVESLITQGLAELQDKAEEASLQLVTRFPSEKIIAHADGRLTWRVLNNLLSNAFSYSLPNSRVYIHAYADEKNAFVEIKNISATELNIPEDEIMERFKRGDSSRSSEGSGLGLDIARSLMTCQNGDLTIKMDGDLFKVTIRIPRTLSPKSESVEKV